MLELQLGEQVLIRYMLVYSIIRERKHSELG